MEGRERRLVSSPSLLVGKLHFIVNCGVEELNSSHTGSLCLIRLFDTCTRVLYEITFTVLLPFQQYRMSTFYSTKLDFSHEGMR